MKVNLLQNSCTFWDRKLRGQNTYCCLGVPNADFLEVSVLAEAGGINNALK